MTDETWKLCWSCGSDYVGPTGGMRIVMCGNCGAGPEEPWRWQTRALAPALDTVLEAVEAFTPGQWRNVSERVYNDSITSKPFGEPSAEHSWREGTLRLLRALRAEQSAEAGGERGGGSP